MSGPDIEWIKRAQACGMSDADIQAYLNAWARPVPAIDSAAERRRAWDRDRKKNSGGNSGGIPVERKVSPHPSKEILPTSSEPKGSSEVVPLAVFPTRKDLDEAVSEWNDLAEMRGLAKVLGLNVKRRKSLTARLRELGSIDEWVEVLVKVRDSPFCCGETTGFRATFDFVLQPSSMIKIREGNYDGTTQGQDRNRPRNYG